MLPEWIGATVGWIVIIILLVVVGEIIFGKDPDGDH